MTFIFNKNPSTPRYTQMWDTKSYFIHLSMKTDQDLSLKEITLKLGMLMDLWNIGFCSEKLSSLF